MNTENFLEVDQILSEFREEILVVRTEKDIYELEKKIKLLMNEVGNRVLQEAVGNPGENHRVKKKAFTSLGKIEIHKQSEFSKRVNSFNMTPLFSEIVTLLGQSHCYGEVEEELSRLLGLDINAMKVHRVTNHYGKLAEKLPISKPPMPKADEHVYAQVDGSFIFTREKEKKWKEVKAGRIFFGKPGSKGNIEHSEYEAIIGTNKEFIEKFEQHLEGYQFLRERLVFVTDGASWIKKWIEEKFPESTQILDCYHAFKHLHDFANDYFKESEKNKKISWTHSQKKLLKNSQVKKVIKNIKALPVSEKVAEEAKEDLLNYYQNNINRMDYKTYQEIGAGIIGSGAIEATHRNLIQKRLKLSGQRWTVVGAQNVLNLRCLKLSDHWEQVRELIRNDTVSLKLAS